MRREPYFKNWKKIKSVSIGLVYVFFILWLIFHTHQYVPEDQKNYWLIVFISYGILNSIIFGSADLRNKLFNVKLISFLPRFLLFGAVSFVGLFFVAKFLGSTTGSAFSMLSQIPLWLAVIHAFVFATTESVIWQGFLDYKIGHPWSELTAGLFHFGIWSGGAFVVIISAALLFACFSLVNWYFRKNKNDLAPAIGTHTAWNILKLGLSFVS
jgi:membrane protease YdiL (CAAX protease family)